MLLLVIDLLIFVVGVMTVGTQIIWPLWSGGPMFPFFRPEARKAHAELRKAEQEIALAAIERDTTKAEKLLRDLKDHSKNRTTNKRT